MSPTQLDLPSTARTAAVARSPETDETDLSMLSALNVVLRRRRLVFGVAALLTTILVSVALLRPRSWTSSASFMPQTTRNTTPGGGIASQLGLSMLATDATQSPSFYVDLLSSRAILDSAVMTRFPALNDSGRGDALLVDLLEAKGRTPALRQDDAIKRLRRAMRADPSPKTGVVTFSVRARDPVLAKQLADRILQLLNTFNLRRRRTQASEERRFAEQRLVQAGAELRVAEDRLQMFLQRNRMYENSPELRFEQDRLSREVNMRQQLYTSVAQSHEQARMDEVRDTPVITVIEQPDVPARPDSRGLLKALIVGVIVGLGLGIGLAFLRELIDRAGTEPGTEAERFTALWRDTLDDLTHPWRLARRGERGARAGR